uniref:Uncharacterized protein n=1 Tax=Alexandrium monilatum TaxID=311494 RepID=A0A7S4VLG5_9DINO
MQQAAALITSSSAPTSLSGGSILTPRSSHVDVRATRLSVATSFSLSKSGIKHLECGDSPGDGGLSGTLLSTFAPAQQPAFSARADNSPTSSRVGLFSTMGSGIVPAQHSVFSQPVVNSPGRGRTSLFSTTGSVAVSPTPHSVFTQPTDSLPGSAYRLGPFSTTENAAVPAQPSVFTYDRSVDSARLGLSNPFLSNTASGRPPSQADMWQTAHFDSGLQPAAQPPQPLKPLAGLTAVASPPPPPTATMTVPAQAPPALAPSASPRGPSAPGPPVSAALSSATSAPRPAAPAVPTEPQPLPPRVPAEATAGGATSSSALGIFQALGTSSAAGAPSRAPISTGSLRMFEPLDPSIHRATVPVTPRPQAAARPVIREEEEEFEQEGSQLHQRLSLLEKLATGVLAVEPPGAGGAPLPAWSGGARDFGAAFTLEPLNGYYIDRARIPLREKYLSDLKQRHEGDQHPFFCWLAGKSDRAKDQVIDERAWRGLIQFA